MSIMSVLNVGARALQTSQLAIDITGQNIANADVAGYSRKRLNITTLYAHDSAYGQMGLGAAVVNIERMRNLFIDEQIRKQNSEVGYFTEVTNTFMRVETILTEPSDFGVMHTIDQFFNSWQNLANNPADLSARTMVMTEAQVMVEHFHATAKELADLRQQKNDEIPLRLNRVNQITQEIYNLNIEVAAVEVTNQNANDSRDRRDLLLKELAELIDITVVENTQGQVTVTTGGSVLVAPTYRQELEPTTIFREQADGSLAREVGIRFSSTRQTYIPTGGMIRGLMDSRDVYIPEYQQKLDELALALVRSVNELHAPGYNLHGYSGIMFFDESVLKDANGNYVTENAAMKIALSPSITSDVRNIAAATAGQDRHAAVNTSPGTIVQSAQITRSGDSGATDIPITANQLLDGSVVIRDSNGNVLESGVDYTVDYASGTFRLSHAGYDGDDLQISFNTASESTHTFGSAPMQLYRDDSATDPTRANNLIKDTVVVRTSDTSIPPGVVLQEGLDYFVDYENGTFQMLHNGYDNAEISISFDYFVGGFKGPGDNSNALAIAELRTKMTMTPDVLDNNTATFAEFISSVIGRLGLNTNQAASNLETRIFLTMQYETQQDMVAGVSLDEEMANLIRYQHTYTAAARLITTVDRMLEILLSM